jgi:hypothetical protein
MAGLKAALLALLAFGLAPASAQFYNGTQMTFGKSRIQYKEFLWTFYKFDDFDTYFYLNGKELAIAASKYASEQIPLMEERLETALNGKIQFLVFNNLTDLRQSNIGLLGDQRYNPGGITHILGSKVFLYFDGSQRNFERQIRSGIANVLLNQVFYGTSVGSQIKNTTLLNVPEWYTNGLLSYLSEEWNSTIDNRVRDGILTGRYSKFNHLAGEDALYAGHSLWRYVADKYGEQAIGEIVNMTHLSRNVENGFLYVIGISFKTLVAEWEEYFRQIYAEEEAGMESPEGQLLRKVKKDQVYGRFRISPDGTKGVYVNHDEGRYKIFLVDMASGKKDKIHWGGFRLEEKVDYSYPLVAWHPESRVLAYIVEKRGEVLLYFYNLRENVYQHITLFSFEKIVDFSYSPDGASLIFSAVQKGQSDLYTFHISSGSFQQLTNDIYDDLNPVCFGDASQVLFASNRAGEKLAWESEEDIPFSVPQYSDLFLYVKEGNRNLLRRITNTPYADEIQPVDLGGGRFAYLSDANGIFNRYLGRYDSTISFIDTAIHYRYYSETYPSTNYSRSILDHWASQETGLLTQVVYKDGHYHLQKEEILYGQGLQAVPQPGETLFKSAGIMKSREKEEARREAELKKSVANYTRRFRNVYRVEKDQPADQEKPRPVIDIRNYVFSGDGEGLAPADSAMTPLIPSGTFSPLTSQDRFKVPKRLNYRVEYSINELATQLDFTSLNYFYEPFSGGISGFNNIGLNGFFLVGLTDLLEDHRIVGGFRIPFNLNNVDYIFSYANLKKRLDKEVVAVRQALEEEFYAGFYTFIARYRSYQLYYMLKYPFSPVLALKGTANVRYQKATLLATNDIGLREPDNEEYWAGVKGELIFDNTKEIGLNLYSGTRFKIFGEYTQTIANESSDMAVVGLDIRHYQKIHRSFIWANRFAASTSFGKNPLIYFMGGVDNWLTPEFEVGTPIDYSMNYAYQALATNMRGFAQNIRNGNNFVMINSELRFPVFRYFFNRPIKSDFLTNFQIVGFGDVGTAWAGPNPYSDENSFYIRYIQDGSLWIKVREMKEPLVGGLGFGARTRLLGYFLRADVAWGIEDRVFRKPQFYFSLSLDF